MAIINQNRPNSQSVALLEKCCFYFMKYPFSRNAAFITIAALQTQSLNISGIFLIIFGNRLCSFFARFSQFCFCFEGLDKYSNHVRSFFLENQYRVPLQCQIRSFAGAIKIKAFVFSHCFAKIQYVYY